MQSVDVTVLRFNVIREISNREVTAETKRLFSQNINLSPLQLKLLRILIIFTTHPLSNWMEYEQSRKADTFLRNNLSEGCSYSLMLTTSVMRIPISEFTVLETDLRQRRDVTNNLHNSVTCTDSCRWETSSSDASQIVTMISNLRIKQSKIKPHVRCRFRPSYL